MKVSGESTQFLKLMDRHLTNRGPSTANDRFFIDFAEDGAQMFIAGIIRLIPVLSFYWTFTLHLASLKFGAWPITILHV